MIIYSYNIGPLINYWLLFFNINLSGVYYYRQILILIHFFRQTFNMDFDVSEPSFMADIIEEQPLQFSQFGDTDSYYSSYPNTSGKQVVRKRRGRRRGRGKSKQEGYVRKRNRNLAIIQRYFVCNQNQDKHTCRLCLQVFEKSPQSTSLMVRHILNQLKESKQPKIQNKNSLENQDIQLPKVKGKHRRLRKHGVEWGDSFLQQYQSAHSGRKVYDKNGNLVKVSGKQEGDFIMKSSKMFGRQRSFYETILSGVALHWTELQIYNYIEDQFQIQRSEISNILKNYYWKYAKDYTSLLNTLKINKNITIIENCLSSMVRNVIIRTNLMKQKFVKYKDCLGFYYFPNPTYEQGLISIVYVLGQDRNIQPVILGLILVLDQNGESFRIMFDSFFEHSKFIPQQVIVCGPPSMKIACDQILQQKLTKNDAPYSSIKSAINCICLKQNIIRVKNEKAILTEIKDLLDSIMQNSGSETSFVGFMISQSYIEKVKQLTPDILGIKTGLQQFLLDFFQMQVVESELKLENQTLQQDDKGLMKMRAFYQIIQIKEVSNIKQRVCKEIFLKFALMFVYGCFYLRIIPLNRFEMHVQQIADDQIWFSKSPNQVVYNVDRNLWMCNCGLTSLIGIPCPHLIKVLSTYSFPLKDYINQRWIIHQPFEEIPNPVVQKHRKAAEQSLIRQLSIIRNNFSLNEYNFLENLWS